jgi:hypothetical protein
MSIGLRQQILVAGDEEKINELLFQGKNFEFASVKTRKRWKLAQSRRVSELRGKPAPVVVQQDSGDVLEKPKKKSKKK